jgi:anti-sigma B factor antagonist
MKPHIANYNLKDSHVIELQSSELNIYNYPEISSRCNDIVKRLDRSRIIIDLTRISSIDSVGVGLLTKIRNAVAPDGVEVSIVCNRNEILKIFEILNIEDQFSTYPSINDAVTA